MYNIYSDEKKLNEIDKILKEKKKELINIQRHKLKTDKLSLNYQKRIKKFIIDVRNEYIIIILFIMNRWLKKVLILK